MVRGDYQTRRVFARRLAELRKTRGLTQTELGRRIGLPYTYISRLERGRIGPSIAFLERLATGSEVEVYQFFVDANTRPQAPKFLRTRVQEVSLLQVFRTLAREDRSLILFMARQPARRASGRRGTSPGEQAQDS